MLVVCRMFLTFFRTRIARIGTGSAHFCRQRSTSCHDANGCRTSLGTVAVETYAHGKFGDVLLIQAGVRAHLARDDTFDARFEARMIRCACSTQILPQFNCEHGRLP